MIALTRQVIVRSKDGKETARVNGQKVAHITRESNGTRVGLWASLYVVSYFDANQWFTRE